MAAPSRRRRPSCDSSRAIGLRARDTDSGAKRKGRVVRRIDMGWPQWKVGVEYDGATALDEPDEFTPPDIERLEFLASRGWMIMRVSARQLRYQRDEIVRRVPAHLRAAATRYDGECTLVYASTRPIRTTTVRSDSVLVEALPRLLARVDRPRPSAAAGGGANGVLVLVVHRVGDQLHRVEPDQVGQPQRTHRMRQPGDDGLVDAVDRGDAGSAIRMADNRYGTSSALTMNPDRSPQRTTCCPAARARTARLWLRPPRW